MLAKALKSIEGAADEGMCFTTLSMFSCDAVCAEALRSKGFDVR